MSQLGHSRRFDRTSGSSGLPLTADMRAWSSFRRNGQMQTRAAATRSLFDHLVGEDERSSVTAQAERAAAQIRHR